MAGEVLIFLHIEATSTGLLTQVLDREHIPFRMIRLYAGERPPLDCSPLAVVSMGGSMSAWDVEDYPFLAEEETFLNEAVRRGTPVLGICLGSQLLAGLFGGRIAPAPHMEVGYPDVTLTAAGAQDPVLSALDGPVLSYHADIWTMPSTGLLLATSTSCNQAFRVGSALGLQFHAEVTPPGLEALVETHRDELYAAGIDIGTVVEEARRLESRTRECGLRLFQRWVDHVRPTNRKRG